MNIRTLASEKVQDKVVLVRVDFNVPLKNGKITETTRIEESLPTLQYLLKHGVKRIHILSHLGRPKGEPDPEFSLKVVAKELEKQLGEKVQFVEDFSETDFTKKVILHENVRFYPGEKKNDPKFVDMILKATNAEVFVNDGFAVSHRAEASVVGFSRKIPCVAGILLEKEIETLSPFLSAEKMAGLTVVIGGAKMETKVQILKHFARTAENILIGGALANTFLAAEGYDVGESLYEPDAIETAQEVLQIALESGTGVHLPIDVICADSFESTETADFPIRDIGGDAKIFDIGIHTINSFEEILCHSKTVIWNGPVGIFEKKQFSEGTKRIAHYIATLKGKTVLGGGDTLAALKLFGIEKSKFTHVSTGGGAMLEFLEGNKLPGVEVVKK
jgi:phosphoglycerate kinase